VTEHCGWISTPHSVLTFQPSGEAMRLGDGAYACGDALCNLILVARCRETAEGYRHIDRTQELWWTLRPTAGGICVSNTDRTKTTDPTS
jgi:hypothetical protein